MSQPVLFDRQNPEPVEPLERVPHALPIQGRTPRARHCSADGARIAATGRGQLRLRYLRHLAVRGPGSDQEAADALRVQRCSINSTRAGCMRELLVRDAEEDVINFVTGARNERWELTDAGRRQMDEARWRMDEKRA